MLLSPITLQAYCNLEGCKGYTPSNLNQVPITMQEARDIERFYTLVERDLSENLEILQDGTHQVKFGGLAGFLLFLWVMDGVNKDLKAKMAVWDAEDRAKYRRWKEESNFLKDYFKDKPNVFISKETAEKLEIAIDDPRGNYRIKIFRSVYTAVKGENIVKFYRRNKSNGKWMSLRFRDQRVFYFRDVYGRSDEKVLRESVEYLDDLTRALQSNNPQVFENYLKARRIKSTPSIVRRAGRFVGRWAFRGVLAGAGIVGGQMLFDYASENYSDETELVIAITKEQYEKLVIDVREIIVEIAEHPILDELELPSQSNSNTNPIHFSSSNP